MQVKKIRAITPVGAFSHRTASARPENRDPDMSGETVPTKLETGLRRRSWKQRLPDMGSKSVYLFLESTIIRCIAGQGGNMQVKS